MEELFGALKKYAMEEKGWVDSYHVSRLKTEDGDLFSATVFFRLSDCPCVYPSNGTDFESAEAALFKAFAEAYERRCSMSYGRADAFVGSMAELKKDGLDFLDPREIIPLEKEQVKRMRVSEITENTRISWTRGRLGAKEGREVLIASDLVYYDGNTCHNAGNGAEKIYYGSSSGIALHTDAEKAKVGALTELIERDAIMRFRANGKPAMRLASSFNKISRIDAFHEMKLFLLPSEYANVIMAVISGDSFPFFACGAAATFSDDVTDAIGKATEEAISSYYGMKFGNCFRISKNYVFSPMEHGLYYAQTRKKAALLDPLFSGADVIDSGNRFTAFSLEETLSRLGDRYTVDMTTDEESHLGLSVVKLIIPKLVPISFGYGLDIFKHPALSGLDAKYTKEPHFFA